MRIFIPTKGRSQQIGAHKYFAGADYTIVVHNAAERDAYLQNPTIDPARLVVSDTAPDTFGLTRQREWICQNLVQPGEWFIFSDDNVTDFVAVPEPWYCQPTLDVQNGREEWKALFDTPCPLARFFCIAQEMIDVATSKGAHWCGFATVPNFFFLGKKYRFSGYVIGKVTVSHNIGVPFDHTISMEDFNNTAEHLLRYGAVVINNFARPVASHYNTGGMGTYQERIPIRKQDVSRLMRKFPGLFRIHDRPGFVQGTDLAIRLTTPTQIATWRRSMLQRRG